MAEVGIEAYLVLDRHALLPQVSAIYLDKFRQDFLLVEKIVLVLCLGMKMRNIHCP